jgi:hypothetical protein
MVLASIDDTDPCTICDARSIFTDRREIPIIIYIIKGAKSWGFHYPSAESLKCNVCRMCDSRSF